MAMIVVDTMEMTSLNLFSTYSHSSYQTLLVISYFVIL